jgi:small-conductance mechanosensitive channel
MWYTLALFVHVLGAIGLFVAVSLIVVAFVRMRRASTVEQVREWASVANVAGKSLVFISLVILAPAVYLVILAWGFATPWVMASLITFIVLAIMGAAVNGRTIERVVAMARAAAPGPIPDELRTQLLAPRLWIAEAVRLALLVGILGLMTLKPDLVGSLLILVGMLLLGIILGALVHRSPGRVSRMEQLV